MAHETYVEVPVKLAVEILARELVWLAIIGEYKNRDIGSTQYRKFPSFLHQTGLSLPMSGAAGQGTGEGHTFKNVTFLFRSS
jgi:hypothetical protein